jgi:hypothetical protein
MEVDIRELIIVPDVPVPQVLRPSRPAGKPIPREEEGFEPGAPPRERGSKAPPRRTTKPAR